MQDHVKPGELLEQPKGQSAAKENGEIFKPIDLNPKYSVSNFGRVRNNKTNKILSPRNLQGYQRVAFYVDGKQTDFRIHRLVAKAFILSPENKPQVNHINGNKSDNHVNNLEWCTNGENVRHALRTGLIDPRNISLAVRGEKHPRAKLSEKQVMEIKKKLKYRTGLSLAKEYNVTPSLISLIRNNKKWSHIQSSTTIES